MTRPCDLIVVGASLGGLEALEVVLAALPPAMPPIAIVQHRLRDEAPGSRLIELLALHTELKVVEPDDKTAIEAGTVYVAPSDYHLQVERGWFSLSTEGPVSFARPSIDVLFETAAETYGRRLIALALTCASSDGVTGAIAVRKHGGRVLVQDPATARSPVLPQAVIGAGVADLVAPLAELPRHLLTSCGIADD